jgi:hypothetical protein
LLAAVITAVISGVLAASALGAGNTLAITPCSSCTPSSSAFTAAGDTSFTETVTFDTTQLLPPSALVLQNAPGLLLSVAANPSCLSSSSYTPACEIGGGTFTTSDGARGPAHIAVDSYLVAPEAAGDLAGIDMLVSGSTNPAERVVHGEISPRQTAGGLFVMDVSLDLAAGLPNHVGATAKITQATFNFNGILNGNPFTRMPSSCTLPAASTATITYGSSTNVGPLTASPDVNVSSSCGLLPYHPGVTIQASRDARDAGTTLVTTISQPTAAVEGATQSLQLRLPSSLTLNTEGVASCFMAPCNIGTASGASPVLPSASLSAGTVTLGGTLQQPTLTINFPAANLTLTGNLNSVYSAITLGNLPDLPLSNLGLNLIGTARAKPFITTCAAGSVTGAFAPWDGNPATIVPAPISYQNCPVIRGRPSLSGGSVSGLSSGRPKLQFMLTHGTNAPDIASVAVGPANGLSFKACIVKSHACSGLSITGATLKSVKLSGGRLLIALSGAATRVTIAAGSRVLIESPALKTKVKKHQVKSLTFTVRAVDAKGNATLLALKLRA